MKTPTHQGNLRALAGEFSTNSRVGQMNREAVHAAADYIDELEGRIRILNRLGNMDTHPSALDELNQRIAALESQVKGFVTKMDIESMAMDGKWGR